jgi:hypothetical protein
MILLKHILIFIAVAAAARLLALKEDIQEYAVALMVLDCLYGLVILGMLAFGAI